MTSVTGNYALAAPAVAPSAPPQPPSESGARRLLRTGRARAARQEQEDEYVEFAQAMAERLRRTAFLMCRDWHLAQDLTQITLTKMYVSWNRIHGTVNVEAYSHKVLMNALFDHRRKGGREFVGIATGDQLDSPAPDTGPELRMTLLEALGTLPERDRAIVVLRYWEDHSVETVAEVMGVSTTVVKSQSKRCLQRLRRLLGDHRALLLEESD
ncbi:RNA polymerase sigma-70 factor (sigma-E family) [Catenuloplanes nepalensis]|uniref:RNA polymerase sigma-70 factor (Sigma-E family) n=1 Tax=Catenuloplanes nepalensis TaxID=587533 RepID=A0ABT9ML45_9ACTN|nr:sigma-70 family RNA polymerase sigma factor [Catenuloplanes nepalensis]MDP9792150.1 RNA polymerase sigma-70 factor (sigma-E family) [Catenuloplanes nepalensis]